jgi:hypothetical protein
VTAALAEADALDAGATVDRVIDTGGRSVAHVADLVLADGWPASGPSRPGPLPPSPAVTPEGAPADGPVVWLAGPTAVGKSTVGFALHLRLRREGLPAAYVDVDQLGFGGDGGHGVKSRNLAAVRRTFRAVGARVLVVTGGLEDDAALATYTAAIPAATFTVLRLRAGRDELVRRALRRGAGHGWRQPGDPLLGRSADALRAIADAAARSGAALTGGADVDTDGRTAGQVTDAVRDLAGPLTT